MMPEEEVVRYCSPTLAGLKTGSMFTLPYSSEQEMIRDLRELNHSLKGKGIRILPLRYSGRRALIYLFRPSSLQQDLQDPLASRMLSERGYPCGSCTRCITRLVQSLRTGEEFPHEIGLFLGYPPDDVQGFIENRAAGCKCIGTWKVYGDEDAAKKRFRQFKICTAVYSNLLRQGKTLEELTVAI